MAPSSLPWIGTGLTDTGRVRISNQDAFAIDNEIGLWVIADGMGGHAGGNIASELAVASIMNHMRTSAQPWPSFGDQLQHATTVLTDAITAGKTAIQERIALAPELRGMGTTVVAAWLCPLPTPSVAIAHVGDSRAYVIRDEHLVALTTDHSLVQQLVNSGQITLEKSWNHPKKNVLVRALGLNFPSTPDIALHPLSPHDILLLCTDGLLTMISEEDILSVILDANNSPEETCQRLITQANGAGGKDNTTVLLITPRHLAH
jgi:serine/threonine protein phosphatase PrpC